MTTPPISKVDICNLARDYLGESPISSIDAPNNEKEEAMSRWYDHTRRVVLREYVWNFARKADTPSRVGDGSDGFADAYRLPNDCVRLLRVGSDPDNPKTDYQLMGREIHIDNGGATSLPIVYTRDVVEIGQMDELFINILALRIAVKLAYKFTKKQTLMDRMEKLLATEELKAISVDGQERPPKRVQKSKYLTARRTGGGILGRGNKYYDFSDA